MTTRRADERTRGGELPERRTGHGATRRITQYRLTAAPINDAVVTAADAGATDAEGVGACARLAGRGGRVCAVGRAAGGGGGVGNTCCAEGGI